MMSKEEKNKTIAEKLKAFEEIIAWFDGETFSLEESLEKYKQAEKMADDIETQLAEIKNEVLVLKQKFDT